MNSRDYWKKREDEARKNTIRDEKEYNARLNEIYEYTIANIERQVNDWYARYASKEGITMAEARGRVKHIDMERYERLAAKYVATHDFSEQANQEMALYNLTMKVNRLELLKAQINLELMAGFDDIQHEMERDLIQTAMKEDRRLAGILGDSVIGNEEYAKQLVNASFRNATFSERIWGKNMPDLRVHLEAELRNGLVQGIGSDELARRFRKHYGGSIRDTERLMTTEMCRLQAAVQKESFERNGYKEYMFITSGNENVCSVCQELHGKHFKVSEMQPGDNAPPMHPRCHCSVAGYMDSDKYKRWIDALANGEDVRWNEFDEWEKQEKARIGREKKEDNQQSKKKKQKTTDANSFAVAEKQLQDSFGKLIDKNKKSKKEYRTKLKETFHKGTQTARKAFMKFVRADSVADFESYGIPGFSPGTKRITLNWLTDLNDKRRGACSAYFHEHGHYIDFMAAGRSNGKYYSMGDAAFSAALRADYESYVQKVMSENNCERIRAYGIISQRLGKHELYAISDMFDGLSNGECYGCASHSIKNPMYWHKIGQIEKESFAHMYMSCFFQEKDKAMDEYFPTAHKEFKRMLKEISR